MAIVNTTLTAAVTALQPSVTVASVTNISNPNFQTSVGITYLLIDQEFMLVTSVNPTTLVAQVARGQFGTPAAAHVNGALVQSGLPGDFGTISEYIGKSLTSQQIEAGLSWPATFLTGSADAINPNVAAFYEIKTAGVDAMTLVAPPAAAEGNIIMIVSDTTNAHTLTATALLANGTALKTTATFPAFRGASLILRASNGVWQVLSSGAVAGTVTFA
jgi:hypothetical protein